MQLCEMKLFLKHYMGHVQFLLHLFGDFFKRYLTEPQPINLKPALSYSGRPPLPLSLHIHRKHKHSLGQIVTNKC